MPNAILHMPSISLAQLKAITEDVLKDYVKVDSAHCYIDFAEFIGFENYGPIGYFGNGLWDWIFRAAAFETPDIYTSFEKYFLSGPKNYIKNKLFKVISKKRTHIEDFLDVLINIYNIIEYDVVGFSSMFSQNTPSFALAKRIKHARKDIITVMGGPNCDPPMNKSIIDNVPQIDYVFSGEGLISFPKFIKELNNSNHESISSIPGIHGRDPYFTNKMRINTPGVNLDNRGINLNALPLLDYSEYLEKVKKSPLWKHLEGELILPFQTSVGCWKSEKVSCSFCGMAPQSFRKMDSDFAITYINELIKRYIDEFKIFEATDPCLPIEYPEEVFPYINQDKKAVIQYECRSNFTIEEMRQMAIANVILPQPGIESFSTKTLKLMRKGVSAFQNIQFLKNCVEEGLYPIWNYLYGLPDKDYDELESEKLINDIHVLYHMPPPCSYMPVGFTRFSEYYDNSEMYGLNLKPFEYYSHIYPFRAEIINGFAYHFRDDKFNNYFYSKYFKTIQAINIEVVTWMTKFRLAIPKLYFKDQFTVYDSRGEIVVEYTLSSLEKNVLIFLDKPRTVGEVKEHFSISSGDASTLIDGFLEKLFLFSENDKHLSVVCKNCRLQHDIYMKYNIDFVNKTSNAFE